MARHCKNQGKVAEERRLEYRGRRIEGINEHLDNLKRVECYDRCLLESAWTWTKGMMT